jgi:hypothetical protein
VGDGVGVTTGVGGGVTLPGVGVEQLRFSCLALPCAELGLAFAAPLDELALGHPPLSADEEDPPIITKDAAARRTTPIKRAVALKEPIFASMHLIWGGS